MISRWFIPAVSGDYRLEAAGSGSVLTIEDPTPNEVERLQAFLAVARERAWVSPEASVSLLGVTAIDVAAPVAEAGPVLVTASGSARPGTLTAVRSVSGVVTTTELLAEATSNADADAAVTVRRPTPCCPSPEVAAEVRASEVLEAFCTPAQWASWTADGFLTCYGRYTGHRYRIAHRCSPLAERQGRICVDLDDRATMHFHDVLLPPPEEVLAAKLILEHREDWLRNESTCLSPRFTQVFRNPLGPRYTDGVASSKGLSAIGGAHAGFYAATGASPIEMIEKLSSFLPRG